MSIRDSIQGAARRLVLVTLDSGERLVFKVKKLRSIDLVRQGRVDVLGAGFVEMARQRQIVEQNRTAILEGAQQIVDDAEREAKIVSLNEQWSAEDDESAKKATEALTSDLEAIGSLLDRFESWVCASVEAAGVFVGDAETEDGLLPASMPIEVAALQIEPLQFVRSAATTESMLVRELGDRVIAFIGRLVMEISLPKPAEVQSFR